MINWDDIKKVHCIGVGGIGVSAVCKMLKLEGKIVSGSDLCESEITKELEILHIPVFFKHKKEHIHKDTDMVIYSPAVPEHNPERNRARELGIDQFSYPEFLSVLSREKNTIAISGTNGKSTTTALVGRILERAGFDPTVIVGSKVLGGQTPGWRGNLRIGTSPYFVVEACEHQAHMLHLYPNIIVLTNLEKDHLDYYKDLDHIIKSFQEFVGHLPPDGVLVLNADDKNLGNLKPQSKVITYGIEHSADIMAQHIVITPGRQQFDLALKYPRVMLRNISLKIPGMFNIYNTLAAIAPALYLGADIEDIIKAVEEFSSTWRRFERVGMINLPKCSISLRPIVISDYAHHPTAIKVTLQAAKEFYPHKRIIAVFQPHHHNRTKKLFNEFVQSFDNADITIISSIYDVCGREQDKDQDVSSYDLVEAIKQKYQNKAVIYTKDVKQTKDIISDIVRANDLVLVMGAGDIDTIARELVK